MVMINPQREPKPKRQIYDHIKDDEKRKSFKKDRPTKLIIDPMRSNPVDTILSVRFFMGQPMPPARLKGWYVLGQGDARKVEGRIVDILPSRDLLVKDEHGVNQVIPFEHVKLLRRNKP